MSRKALKNIMLVCGSGIATSSLIAPMVEEILKDNKINYKLIKGSINDISTYDKNVDLVLTTVPLPKEVSERVPVVVVIELLAGKKEEVSKKIMKTLSNKETS